jgi:hypothetical protein
MHFVILGDHSADICPLSNAKTKALLMEMGPQIPGIAQRLGVQMVAGPFVSREHLTVAVVESDSAEAVDEFVVQTRLVQWNRVRVIPSRTMEEGMKEIAEGVPLF